ncbi:MAG: DUF4145 domain-containing protein [Theionarchaea archaeon]|nr:DUF4145 domain-containing protein [Theionarchaea archaeon]
MKCPHCLVEFHPECEEIQLGNDIDELWFIYKYQCPSCERMILYLVNKSWNQAFASVPGYLEEKQKILIYPRGSSRPPLPEEVPKEFVEDYKKACLVLTDSPEASAALSRRCLQRLLREKAMVNPSNLYEEIEAVLPELPSHLTEMLHMVREIGNFAAHPNKSEKTGEILPVEPEEAEWNLEVLEELFDFYFVQPERIKKRKDIIFKKKKEVRSGKSK